MIPTSSASPEFEFDVRHHLQLYVAGDFDRLSADFLRALKHFASLTSPSLSDADSANLLRFLKTFLTVFTQPDYTLSGQYAVLFVQKNYLLSNLVALTPLRNTDLFLELLRGQSLNLAKLLTLYSARNSVRLDRRKLFDADPMLASYWYQQFCTIYHTGLVREDIVQHLREHLAYRDERMKLVPDLEEPYYGSTYVDGALDREVKPFLNQTIRRSLPFKRCDNRPDPKKIAVISDSWLTGHSVYRTLAGYVANLKEKFHLTLFHITRARERIDVGLFDEVRQLEMKANTLHLEPLNPNDFMVAYFPDVGMNLPSILLANHRIAPIQIMGTGHPVSTWGAEIDYFFGGRLVDLPHLAARNYSEWLVLLPGMGAIHNWPLYQPTGRKKSLPAIVINCPGTGHKLHAAFLGTIRKLLDRVERPVHLRFFPGLVQQTNAFLPFVSDVRQILGERASVEFVPFQQYAEYMGLMEEADLSLDPFHFGGSNTVADSLFLRKPTVVWEGDKWYNRIGPSMLRLVGLNELICVNENEYLAKALLLIHDDRRREEFAAKLRAADLNATVFSTEHASSFRLAVDYLIENHERLKGDGSREPIVIE